jgi:hypothetical protein
MGKRKAALTLEKCPCCGNRRLYKGHLSVLDLGVECHPAMGGCGLKLARTIPDKMPKGLKTLEDLDRYALNQAVAAWNQRAS